MTKFFVSIALLSGFTVQASAAEMFYQDDHYIYRSIPTTLDVTDEDLMSRLGQAATEDIVRTTSNVLADLGEDEKLTELEKVEKEITSFFEIQANLDDLNEKIEVFKEGERFRRFNWATDMLPKALTFFVGYSGAISKGPGAGISFALGLTMMMDKVDRIAKADIAELAHSGEPLTLDEIEFLFGEMRADFADNWVLLTPFQGLEREVERDDGSVVRVWSNFEFDVAPVFMAAPAVGIGIGGGKAWRFGFSAAWWRGNKIMEPEDLRGYGLAFSQDFSIGVGANVKLGLVDSDNVTGWVDYLFGSFAVTIGTQAEFSPAKANLLILKDPLAALEMIGLKGKADAYLQRSINTAVNEEWRDLIGQPAAGPPGRPSAPAIPGVRPGSTRVINGVPVGVPQD